MMANIPRLNVRIVAEDSSVPVLESVPGAKRGAQPIRLKQKFDKCDKIFQKPLWPPFLTVCSGVSAVEHYNSAL